MLAELQYCDATIEGDIHPGERGQLDVIIDGKLMFSKQKEGSFPKKFEVARRLLLELPEDVLAGLI